MLWDYLIISFSLRFHWKQNFDNLCIICSQRNNYALGRGGVQGQGEGQQVMGM